MAIEFTPEQQKVIGLHGCNILVSAAAGSGKTAVLVERIVQMVCDAEHPVDIDRLLIVTFTNAAAAEMRERIAAGIAARLALHPESEHIQRQATLLHNAQITTIDSFCLFLLRNHFHEIGLDPAFRIADEGEIRLMEQEALGELLEEAYAAGDEAFRYCVEFFCPGGREGVLERHVLNLSRYAASFPWPEEWLAERKEDYGARAPEEADRQEWKRYLCGHLRGMAEGCAGKLRQVRELCQEPDGPYMYGEMVDQELEQLEKLGGCGSLEEYGELLPAVAFGRLSSKKDESVDPEKRELAKRLRAEVKDCVQGLAARYFSTPWELAAAQGAECGGPVCTLIDLVLDFDRRMAEKKRERKIIDFSDMEHFALDILLDRKGEAVEPSRVALEYRQHFAEILIDEYQDSNLVQEYLLQAVSGEAEGHHNRFMVGDVKQSIYKFRLARPELFLEKYKSYTADEGSCRRIDLSRNFRSRIEVVDTVNKVFSRLMGPETGGIEYDAGAALYPGASYPDNEGCDSELLLAEKPGRDSSLGAKRLEAGVIANKIRELREGFRVTDRETGKLRPARFSDMVILLRSGSGWAEEFREVLEEEGIPVYVPSRTGYFAAAEVQELLQFLQALDNPTQDIPLFGVMKSVFGGFAEEEIAVIRSGRKEGSLYEALKAFSAATEDGGDAALREKARAFLEMLKAYRACTVYMPIRDLLTKIVTDFDYLNYVTALPAGGRRRANVEMLFTRASDFEKTSYFGLFHFVRYMEQLEKYEVDYGEADLLDENADVVRIMSIHKSKGLEFPVTFVAGLSKRFNMQDVNQSLIVDMDLGLGVDYVDPVRRLRNKTLRRLAIAAKLREESLSEELRVLYVAMTRAKEKLILTAVLEDAEEKWAQCGERDRGPMSYLDFMEAGSYLDMLLPTLAYAGVRVTVTREEELCAEGLKEQLGLGGRQMLLERLEKAGEAEETETGERLWDPGALALLRERLDAPYRFAALAGLYTKTTVSELKIAAMADRDEEAYHTFEEKEIQPYIPAFRRGEEKISGTVRGNAYHRVMELLDFEKLAASAWGRSDGAAGERAAEGFPGDYEAFVSGMSRERLKEALAEFLEGQVAEKRLSREYREAVRDRKILGFLTSPLGYRMWRAQRAGKLYREQPFVLGIDAKRLNAGLPSEETLLIQGIIDVFFVEEDGMVLLDYKTDAVDTMEELWNRYETQLDYYQEALQKLMGLPVKERLLYSFHLESISKPGSG